MRPQLGVAHGPGHLLPGEQSDLVGAAVLRELLQHAGLGLRHGGDVGSGLGGPETGGPGGVEPPLPCGGGHVLDHVRLTREARVAEVLDGRAHGAVGGVDDAHAASLTVGAEGDGQAQDAGAHHEKVC